MNCNDFVAVEKLQVAKCSPYLSDCLNQFMLNHCDRWATSCDMAWFVMVIWVCCCKYATCRFPVNYCAAAKQFCSDRGIVLHACFNSPWFVYLYMRRMGCWLGGFELGALAYSGVWCGFVKWGNMLFRAWFVRGVKYNSMIISRVCWFTWWWLQASSSLLLDKAAEPCPWLVARYDSWIGGYWTLYIFHFWFCRPAKQIVLIPTWVLIYYVLWKDHCKIY